MRLCCSPSDPAPRVAPNDRPHESVAKTAVAISQPIEQLYERRWRSKTAAARAQTGDDAATTMRRRGDVASSRVAIRLRLRTTSASIGFCLRRASAARKQRVRISRRISAAAGLDNLPLRLSSRKSRAPDGRRQEASVSRRTGQDGGDERTVVVDNGRV